MIVAMLPAYFRFAQCLRRYRDSKEAFPHLANAGKLKKMIRMQNSEKKHNFHNWISFSRSAKYASSFFVIIFSSITFATTEQYSKSLENPFFYLWIISAIVSSFFAYGWDVLMDWGLMSMEGENKFLRDEIVYSSGVSFSRCYGLI